MRKIIAAGGLVQNSKSEYLFIFRKGKWDLPKGKLDEGEEIRDAAVREVMEECGLPEVTIIRPIVITYHNYKIKNEKVLKETHWFLMSTQTSGDLKPQEEEDITAAIWVDKNRIQPLLENSFDTIREVVKKGTK